MILLARRGSISILIRGRTEPTEIMILLARRGSISMLIRRTEPTGIMLRLARRGNISMQISRRTKPSGKRIMIRPRARGKRVVSTRAPCRTDEVNAENIPELQPNDKIHVRLIATILCINLTVRQCLKHSEQNDHQSIRHMMYIRVISIIWGIFQPQSPSLFAHLSPIEQYACQQSCYYL